MWNTETKCQFFMVKDKMRCARTYLMKFLKHGIWLAKGAGFVVCLYTKD